MWRQPRPTLPPNYLPTLRSFYGLKRKFEDPEYTAVYVQRMDAAIEAVRVPRGIKSPFQEVADQELHIFVDASTKGLGAVVYQRTVYFDGEASDRLAMSKARIAPLKFPTIPRLELQAAVARLRVGLKVAEELRIPKTNCCFWPDSQTVLQWINSASRRYHVFVANRIAEILDDTSPAQWRHVPGNINQADELSRGSQPEDFVTSDTWFTGPEFLRGPENIWPSSNLQLDQEDQEAVSQHWISATQVQPVSCKSSLHGMSFLCYSDMKKAVRIVAWIKRLIEPRAEKTLNAEQIRRARIACIKLSQKHWFAQEVQDFRKNRQIERTSSLLKHTPHLDNDGVLRVGGRIDKAALTHERRHPAILHPKSKLTQALIREEHNKNHGSVKELPTLNELRERYNVQEAALPVALLALNSGQLFDVRALDNHLVVRACQLTLNKTMARRPAENVKKKIVEKATDLRAATLEALHWCSLNSGATSSQPAKPAGSTQTKMVKVADKNGRKQKGERRTQAPNCRLPNARHTLLHGAPRHHQKTASAMSQPRDTTVCEAIAPLSRTKQPLLDFDDDFQRTIGVVVPLMTPAMLLRAISKIPKKEPDKLEFSSSQFI